MYNNLIKNESILREIIKREPVINTNYIKGPFVEILDSPGDEFEVSFIDKKTGRLHHKGTISENHWIKASKSYFIDWQISINKNNGEKIYNIDLNLKNKRVFICFESSSLGDNLAWIPYVDEFRKKHNCHVICSTFWNSLFEKEYPEIEFISRGVSVNNISAQYNIGLFYDNGEIDYNKHPSSPITKPLLEICSNILGLEYKEIKPKVSKPDNIIKKKQVSIAIHSTAQTKYWNNKTGWQEVVDYLKSINYEVIILSKENDGYMGNSNPIGAIKMEEGPIENVMKTLLESELFIGISSGLSWLSWSLDVPTVIISGFTDDNLEPKDVIRIINKDVCNGCWSKYKFDPGDWNWCPVNKGTDKQFECSKSITGEIVIEKIRNIIH